MPTLDSSAELLGAVARARTLVDAFVAAPRDRPFVTVWQPGREPLEETLTFGEFLDRARVRARVLQAHGVRRRDTVVLIMPSGVAVMEAFVAAMLLGAVPTILAYPTFKVDPAKYRHGLAGVTKNLAARLVVVDGGFPSDLLAHIDTPVGAPVLNLDDAALPAGDAGAIGDAAGSIVAAADPGDVAFIQHSAGTTGLQKGVALRHDAVLNQLRHLVEALRIDRTDVVASWLPLYHDMGLVACFVLPLALHLRLAMESPTDWVMRPCSILELVTQHRCTLAWMPNFAFQFLARRVPPDARQDLDLGSLRAIVNCSEPVRRESLDEFARAFAPAGLSASALRTSYAMAENTFAVTQSAHDPGGPVTRWLDRDVFVGEGRAQVVAASQPGALAVVSSGRCLTANTMRIVAPDGRDVPEGRRGEILVRSDSLFEGYYNRPDLSERALRDGWYWTRDEGFVLDGELYVLGRKDDTLIVAGKNLYPQDIEEAVSTHPSVRDGRVVAFALDNADLGTEDLVVLAEVTDESELERRRAVEADLRRIVVGEFDVVPRVVQLVPPKWIIKSTAGKPARSINRDKFLRERALDAGPR
jgi:acyl-CoA synthetase (AMP-forming)/AMP-acid ligase II